MAGAGTEPDGSQRQPLTGDTILFRHVARSEHNNGRVTSQAFLPKRKDNNRLSMVHGGMISAADAQRAHIAAGYQSDGVARLTVSDIREMGLEPEHDGDPTPDHVSVPFPADVSNSRRKDIARRLASRCEWEILPEAH